jgi:hypothetical protein
MVQWGEHLPASNLCYDVLFHALDSSLLCAHKHLRYVDNFLRTQAHFFPDPEDPHLHPHLEPDLHLPRIGFIFQSQNLKDSHHLPLSQPSRREPLQDLTIAFLLTSTRKWMALTFPRHPPKKTKSEMHNHHEPALAQCAGLR